MRLIEKAFALAQEDLKFNWKELPGKESNPLILATYKAVDDLGVPEYAWDDSEIPWCSCYMNKKMQDAGGRGTRSGLARSWCNWGRPAPGNPGDIVIFRRGDMGHVGFVFKKNKTVIYTLGGNESNSVSTEPYSIERVLGFRTSLD